MTGCPRKSLSRTVWSGVRFSAKSGAGVPAGKAAEPLLRGREEISFVAFITNNVCGQQPPAGRPFGGSVSHTQGSQAGMIQRARL